MDSSLESGDTLKSRPGLSELIRTEPVIHKKASSRLQLTPDDDEEKNEMEVQHNGEAVAYRLYKRRWLGLGEHTSQRAYEIMLTDGWEQRAW